jgi:hypothetical protein
MSELSALKINFVNLTSIRINIRKLFESLNGLKDKLKTLYLEYIEIGKKNNILFGIDSFHFQKKLIDLEYENMEKMYKLIDNKMYCEYYKLFKLITKYAEEKINDKKIQALCKLKSKYPVYKDLDEYKVYEFELINDLHHDIIQILDEMFNYSIQKEKELRLEEEKTSNGLNIDNYVNTLMFDNAIINQNIRLYKNYLKVFHKYHSTYLNRLYIKLGIMWGQINQDIRLSSTASSDKNNINDMIVNKTKPLSPKISTSQQAELYKFMKDSGCDNDNFRTELDTIISHISSDGDDLIDENNKILNFENNNTLSIEVKENNIVMDVKDFVDKIENQEEEKQELELPQEQKKISQEYDDENGDINDEINDEINGEETIETTDDIKLKKKLKKKRQQQNRKK